METLILVAYATRYGATADISEAIGAVLREHELTVDVLPVEQVDNLNPYGAVVLGSAVYAGNWRKDAAAFLERHEQQLATRPVWLFSSGPTGEGKPSELMQGWQFPEAQKVLVEHIQPQDIAFFHGVLDTQRLNFAEKLIVKALRAPVGDYRDWETIREWAASIAHTLKSQTRP